MVVAQKSVPAPSALASLDEMAARSVLQSYEQSGLGWFWTTDGAGRITYISPSIAALITGSQDLAFQFLNNVFEVCDEHEGPTRTLGFLLAKRISFSNVMVHAPGCHGERRWLIAGVAAHDGNGDFVGFHGSAIDITAQMATSEEAERLAMYDSLTGLPNRRQMNSLLSRELLAGRVSRKACAVLLIDLDRFKQVNDTLGHPAGDVLLQHVTTRLVKIVGDKERVFRIGGDEFKVLIPGCSDRSILGDLASDIIAALSQPYSINGSRCIIGASVGIAIAPVDGCEPEELTRNVDLALYAAKGAGKGRFCFFSTSLLQAAIDRRALESDLRDALAGGGLQVHYQPIVDVRSNAVTGVEALVRWHHHERGPISPGVFIPVAEEADLIRSLGEWVLRKACEDAARWPGEIRVAVNVSAHQFLDPSFPRTVVSALANSGLAPARLELEITEGVFLGGAAQTDAIFAALKQIGVRLALDDFGTGYSALGYLKSAPFDKIKIDQSFVRDIALPGSRNVAIISAIVALAEALGMDTTAEGIESFDQLDLIRNLRVSHVQGYIYSKPVPTEHFIGRLTSGDWKLLPSGPARQRSQRKSLYRRAAILFGGTRRPVVVRNLSATGAFIEGIEAFRVGDAMAVDFGDGQLVGAIVRRTVSGGAGIEFAKSLVSDGQGGLCTRLRVSPMTLAAFGLSSDLDKAEELPQALRALADLQNSLGVDLFGGSENNGPAGVVAVSRTKLSRCAQVITMEQLAGRYLHEFLGNRQRTREVHEGLLRDLILPQFGRLRLDEMAYADTSSWLEAIIATGHHQPEVATRARALLSYLITLARRWRLPGAETPLLDRHMDNAPSRAPTLAPDAITRLLDAAHSSQNPQLGLIVSLLLRTRLRVEEVLGAKWGHIDIASRQWTVFLPDGTPEVTTFSSAVATLLKEVPHYPGSDFVVTNPRTGRAYRSVTKSWEVACKRAGLNHLSLYELRSLTS